MVENLKLGLFDFFSYLIPGGIVEFGVLILFSGIHSQVTSNDSPYYVVLLFIVAYVIGFSINLIGGILLKYIGLKIWPMPKISNKSGMRRSEKYVLVREYSPNNLKYIESWNVLKGMASNLALSTIFIFGIGIFKCFDNSSSFGFWIFISCLSFFIACSSLRQSVKFMTWSEIDLENSVNCLNLKKHLSNKP